MTRSPIAGCHNGHVSHELCPSRGEEEVKPTDWNRDSNKGSLLQCRADIGDKVPQEDPDQHGQENPYRQKAIEEAEGLEC